MRGFLKVLPIIIVFLLIIIYFSLLIRNGNLQLLNPQGYISQIQSQILWFYLGLALVISILLISTIFIVAFRYRVGNHKRYEPDWTGGKKLIISWYLFPSICILFLSVMVWKTAHLVDPYSPIKSNVKPIIIQVVALRWKWLFIYPNQKIATVNFIEVPVNTPINFQLTADAPMNSFWIPSLGGQIYAMTGMVTQLHLMVSKTGIFPGSAAEISGEGFSGMDFKVKAVQNNDFSNWVAMVKKTNSKLDLDTYNKLAKPSSNTAVMFYNYTDSNLYNQIIMKFMVPQPTNMPTKTMENMDMKGMKM